MNIKMWVTRTGEKIRIKDMTDHHLINTIDYIRRNARAVDLSCPCNGDKDWCFCNADDYGIEPEDYCESYPHLVREAKKRKILVGED